ncbi:MAG: hypothetical protein LBO20_04065 [Bifidobacteriaceae bacterium]|jgi:hypothetical protein|nr:hypothetical protein [Bifidobacteriaceae bacterium]
MVEVTVSVVVLTLFSAAALSAVGAATASSTDNRARVGAASLAQRELDLIGHELTAKPDALSSLIASGGGVAVNPNQDPSIAGSSADFPFVLDGEAYRVERRVSPQIGPGSEALCENASNPTKGVRQGALVTVTVTWASLKDSSKPHVASKLFAPPKDTAAGLAQGTAVIAVKVTGKDGVGGAAARAGIRVEASGNGASEVQFTDKRGCAVLSVTPGGASVDYTVTITGGQKHYVDPAGDPAPSQQVSGVGQGAWQSREFKNYDLAAALSVHVKNKNELVNAVTLTPASLGSGEARQAPIGPGGIAVFENVYPGIYSVAAGNSDPVMVTLAPGDSKGPVEVTVK